MFNLFKKESQTPIDMSIYAPMNGALHPLSDVNDPVFSQEMMGKGCAIYPTEGKVYAPVNGKVETVFRTKHAITLKAANGADIIIHVGLETVGLDGKYFESHVKDGQSIKKGDLLLSFDLEAIRDAGFDLMTPIVIANTNEFESVEMLTPPVKLQIGDAILQLKN